MLFVSRGYTKLVIENGEDVWVKVGNVPAELRITSAAIAKSLKPLLQYKVKHSLNPNKEQVIADHFIKAGWNVEEVNDNPL